MRVRGTTAESAAFVQRPDHRLRQVRYGKAGLGADPAAMMGHEGGVIMTIIPLARAPSPAMSSPLLERIRIATIAAPDIAAIESLYSTWLDQTVRERGRVPAQLAASWGAPDAAGRPYVLLATDPHPDVFIRVVETDAVPGYRAMTTWG